MAGSSGADRRASALDGKVLTREELADEVARLTGAEALGEKVRGSWGAFLKPAAFRGDLCFGPSQGQRVSFAAAWTCPGHRDSHATLAGWLPVVPTASWVFADPTMGRSSVTARRCRASR
jgi:hypothetical protein